MAGRVHVKDNREQFFIAFSDLPVLLQHCLLVANSAVILRTPTGDQTTKIYTYSARLTATALLLAPKRREALS